jgi:hypothetical protein
MAQAKEIDWETVREFYDSGHTIRECKSRFGFSNYAWDKAVAAGKLTPARTQRSSGSTKLAPWLRSS